MVSVILGFREISSNAIRYGEDVLILQNRKKAVEKDF